MRTLFSGAGQQAVQDYEPLEKGGKWDGPQILPSLCMGTIFHQCTETRVCEGVYVRSLSEVWLHKCRVKCHKAQQSVAIRGREQNGDTRGHTMCLN